MHPATEPRKETIATRTAAAVRAEILAGTLPPGAKVNLDRLREKLDVSLAPVREAMGRLVAEGLVEVEEQRGYRIAPVSRANLDEVTRLRQTLEVMALGLAIERGDIDWEGAVIASLHRLARTPAEPGPERAAAHAAFHAALASGAGMPMLAALCGRFRTLHERYHRLLPPGTALPHDHDAIAKAAVARDASTACRLLSTHIARTGTSLAEALADRLPERTD